MSEALNKVIRPKGIKKILAVVSGKGGVGKSSLAVQLAVVLAELGYRIALLDLDIYGPSTHHMLGVSSLSVELVNGNFQPYKAHGVEFNSMGLLLHKEAPLVWRGPLLSKALHQLMLHTDWGQFNSSDDGSELDLLIIDTPPGTGDIHLTLAQNYLIDGAMIVSTPQNVAMSDSYKSALLMQKMGVPLLGLVHNMGYLPDKSQKNTMFDLFRFFRKKTQKKGQRLFVNKNKYDFFEKLSVKLWADLPFDPDLAASLDRGQPLTLAKMQAAHPLLCVEFKKILQNLQNSLAI